MKGKTIYIVNFDSTYDGGVIPFEKYSDALACALTKMNEFENEVDCDEEWITKKILQQEMVSNNNSISHTPFRARVDADNSEEDYLYVEIVKETIQ